MASQIPSVYRHLLTTIEPLLAVIGAITAVVSPNTYLSSMTRHAGPSHDPRLDFLYTQLAGAWALFAFLEAVLLRRYARDNDANMFRLLCAGMLLSDLPYGHGTAQAVGGWASWADLSQWTVDDWAVFVMTAPMVLARVLVVLGVGMPRTGGAAAVRRKAA